jgi:peptidoglycan/LPS O-acetylase OafA/YrhL
MHFRVLDSWRGIVALLVALFHLNVLSAIYSLDFIRNGYLLVDFFFVLGGHLVPIVVTMLYLGLLVAVASISYCLIEKPEELSERLARWRHERSRVVASYFG